MTTDLTTGKPAKVLWRYTLPLFGSVVFQQIYNIADSVVAGKFIGQNALAAVGNSYEITLIYLAFAIGCNLGASVVAAKLMGAKRYGDVKTSVYTSFIATGVTCLALMLIGFLASGPILRLLKTPPEIFADSLTYLNIYTGGLVFLFLYNLSTGIFAALGNSKTPFIFLVVSSLANIGMDVLFVAVFKLGVAGIAWATFICQGVSSILAIAALIFELKKIKHDAKPKLFSKTLLRDFLVIAIPSTLQQGFVSVGNLAIQGLINSFGTATIAGYSAAIKFNNFVVTSFVTIGNGMSNYTAQNLGADKPERVHKGFFAGLLISEIIAVVFLVLYQSAGRYLMLLFLRPEESEAIAVGVKFLTIVSPFFLFVAAKPVSDGILRGAAKMGLFLTTTFTDLIVRVALSFGFAAIWGSTGIWLSWPFGWVLGAILSVAFFAAGLWNRPPLSKSFRLTKRELRAASCSDAYVDADSVKVCLNGQTASTPAAGNLQYCATDSQTKTQTDTALQVEASGNIAQIDMSFIPNSNTDDDPIGCDVKSKAFDADNNPENPTNT